MTVATNEMESVPLIRAWLCRVIIYVYVDEY